MTEKKMQLEDWLDDLCVRFIINLPWEELESVERICFQVEEAQWFYEDFIRPLDPALPSLSLKAFAMRIFQHCPLMSQWSHYHHITAFSEFLAYKTRVPVRGAIMLNEAMDQVVLVKGWKKGANWSFPRGKINKDEKDLDCAVREVYEETGFDIQAAGLVRDEKDMKYIEITMREQHMRLYVFRGVPLDTYFEPRTRKEISKIEWYKLSELPTLKKNKHADENVAITNANKFYMVAPFLHPLKKWIAQQKKRDHIQTPYISSAQVTAEEATEEETDVAALAPTTLGIPTHSDLPEVAAGPDASAHLKRLLNINNLGAPTPPASTEQLQAVADSSKSSALLNLLRNASQGASAREPVIATEPVSQTVLVAEHKQAPVQQLQHSSFASLSQTHSSSPAPQEASGTNYPMQVPLAQPSIRAPYGPFSNRTPPHGNPIFHDPRLQAQAPSSRQPGEPGHMISGLGPHPLLQNRAAGNYTAAPYQRTGDPEFSHAPNAAATQMPSIPPASKLPPPKLTTHSLALLNVFKSGSPQLQKAPTLELPSQSKVLPSEGHKPTSHQDSLVNLFKKASAPVPKALSPRPVELSAQSASPKQQPASRLSNVPRRDPQSRPQAATRISSESGPHTFATVSGPLNVPQFEMLAKAAKKTANGTNPKRAKDRQTPASPITILARPNAAKPEESPVQPAPKPFQPQILRRPPQAGAIDPSLFQASPKAEKAAPVPSEVKSASPKPDPSAPLSHGPRPSQTAAQKETLLSLFGKSTPKMQPLVLNKVVISPPTQSPSTSAVISPLDDRSPPQPEVSQLTKLRVSSVSPTGESVASVPTLNNATSPVNKAFLLGYLEGVAKGGH